MLVIFIYGFRVSDSEGSSLNGSWHSILMSGVSENWGVAYFGVLVIRILLFRVLYQGQQSVDEVLQGLGVLGSATLTLIIRMGFHGAL